MNLRQLTPTQVTDLQDNCQEAYRFRRAEWKNGPTPPQETIWNHAFSAGVKAALALIPSPATPLDTHDRCHGAEIQPGGQDGGKAAKTHRQESYEDAPDFTEQR